MADYVVQHLPVCYCDTADRCGWLCTIHGVRHLPVCYCDTADRCGWLCTIHVIRHLPVCYCDTADRCPTPWHCDSCCACCTDTRRCSCRRPSRSDTDTCPDGCTGREHSLRDTLGHTGHLCGKRITLFNNSTAQWCQDSPDEWSVINILLSESHWHAFPIYTFLCQDNC